MKKISARLGILCLLTFSLLFAGCCFFVRCRVGFWLVTKS